MQNFRALEAPPPDPRASGLCPKPPASGGWVLRSLTPIANFWLRAWVQGPHILKIVRENHSTHSQISLKQRKANKSFAYRRNCKSKTRLNQLECDLAVGLFQNPNCAAHTNIIDTFQFWQKPELNFI